MAALERRIEALEAQTQPTAEWILIQRRIVRPGVPAGEAATATALGQRFNREASETESEFLERVRAYVAANRNTSACAAVMIVADEMDIA